jgi:hypothetical protein
MCSTTVSTVRVLVCLLPAVLLTRQHCFLHRQKVPPCILQDLRTKARGAFFHWPVHDAGHPRAVALILSPSNGDALDSVPRQVPLPLTY